MLKIAYFKIRVINLKKGGMENQVIEYVQQQLSLGYNRLKNTVTRADQNKTVYPKRYIYSKLKEYFDDFHSLKSEKRWFLIPGLRGIGKTTVLSQLFLDIYEKIDDNKRILCLSLDDAKMRGFSLLDIIESYKEILGQSFEKLEYQVFLFIDETQYDSQWGLTLKTIYDCTKKAFVCCTGSSALTLQTNVDVNRRAITEKLYPLSFTEYQMLKRNIHSSSNLKEKLKEAVYYSKDSQEVYTKLKKLNSDVQKYWIKIPEKPKIEIRNYLQKGTIPSTLDISNTSHVFRSIQEIINKIILEDITHIKSFNQATLSAINTLLFLISSSDTLSIHKLADRMNLSKITIQQVLDAIEQTELLIRILPYGSNPSKMTKPSKYLFASPTIRAAFLGITGKHSTFLNYFGKYLEDVTAIHLTHEFTAKGIGDIKYDPQKGGADFIVQVDNSKQIVIEIGMGKKDCKQSIKTLKKISGDYAVIISDNIDIEHLKGQGIVKMPMKFFLMM